MYGTGSEHNNQITVIYLTLVNFTLSQLRIGQIASSYSDLLLHFVLCSANKNDAQRSANENANIIFTGRLDGNMGSTYLNKMYGSSWQILLYMENNSVEVTKV